MHTIYRYTILRTSSRLALGAACSVLFALSASSNCAAAGAVPEAGTILRNIKPEPVLPKKSTAAIEISSQAPSTDDTDIKIEIKGWRITGAVLIPELELQEFLKRHIGKAMSLAEIRKITQDIAAFYQDRGFFARAVLPTQQVRDGIVEILIREAKLGKVDVEDSAGSYRSNVVKQTMLAAQAEDDSLRLKDLQRGILLLNDLPGGTISSTLKPGTRAGESDLNLKVDPVNLVSGSIDYANSGVRSVGLHQFGGTFNLNNPFKIGDLATLRVQGGSGNVYGRFAYSLPIGYSGLRIGVSASGLDYSLGEPFESLNAHGSAWTGGTFATYPLIRGVNSNLYLLGGFDDRRYYNTSLNNVISDKEVQAGYIGFSGDYQDHLLSGAVSQFSANMVSGNVDLSDDPNDAHINQTTAQSNGAYQKFLLNFSRLQNISDSVRIFANFSGQLATKNLDSSEKFSLGGPFGVRAYPVNEALGDEGYLMNFEVRYQVYEHIELVGFIDHGGITLHNTPWANSNQGIANHYTLSGGGVGINWSIPGNFMVRGSLAQRIGSNPALSSNGNDSDGSYQTPHFWVSLSKFF